MVDVPRVTVPDWQRLGARFGVQDVCVSFPKSGVVVRMEGGMRVAVAEDAVALREGPEGVSVQVACGLFIAIPGARLLRVGAGGMEAVIAVPAVPPREGRDGGGGVRRITPKPRPPDEPNA